MKKTIGFILPNSGLLTGIPFCPVLAFALASKKMKMATGIKEQTYRNEDVLQKLPEKREKISASKNDPAKKIRTINQLLPNAGRYLLNTDFNIMIFIFRCAKIKYFCKNKRAMSFFSKTDEAFKSFRDKLMGHRFFRIIFNKYFIAVLVFVISIIFIDRNNAIRFVQTAKEIGKLQKQKAYYENGIRSADEKLNQLKSNRDSLEKFAREQYYFHKDGEDVYVFEKTKNK
jgi:cell division protein FtsB